ncbi:hypothetical protein ILYODFUR_009075 [Ilyodon furcidens]|uniref:Uncharacterized protein n=1 Tax=Ilyodon furcidens TaxID=33524 RepID=A0ABV0UQC5_9TELE
MAVISIPRYSPLPAKQHSTQPQCPPHRGWAIVERVFYSFFKLSPLKAKEPRLNHQRCEYPHRGTHISLQCQGGESRKRWTVPFSIQCLLQAERFKYLGVLFMSDGRMERDINWLHLQ